MAWAAHHALWQAYRRLFSHKATFLIYDKQLSLHDKRMQLPVPVSFQLVCYHSTGGA